MAAKMIAYDEEARRALERGALAVATLPAAGPVGGVHGPALASPPVTVPILRASGLDG